MKNVERLQCNAILLKVNALDGKGNWAMDPERIFDLAQEAGEMLSLNKEHSESPKKPTLDDTGCVLAFIQIVLSMRYWWVLSCSGDDEVRSSPSPTTNA